MANHVGYQTIESKAVYRVVTIPIAASPCRNCSETLCRGRMRCPHLMSVRNDLLSEMSGYGVSENNY